MHRLRIVKRCTSDWEKFDHTLLDYFVMLLLCLMLKMVELKEFCFVAASSAGATWLSILSILILCVAPARFLNRDKKSGGRVKQVQ